MSSNSNLKAMKICFRDFRFFLCEVVFSANETNPVTLETIKWKI